MGKPAMLPVYESNYVAVKRLLDIVLAAAALVVLLVPMLLIAAAVYIDDPGCVIFSQNRVGRHGKTFVLYKFRTMRQDTPQYLSSSEMTQANLYITRTGHVLRKTSLDELPQLLNVLRGDMSLIGPRPLIPQEKSVHHMRLELGIYEIRPGITGLAQINGRDRLADDEKVRFDKSYLENFGFLQDLSIFVGTLAGFFGADRAAEGPAIREQ